MDNVIKFERKKPTKDVMGGISDSEALDNYNTLLNILKINMDMLSTGEVDNIWFILSNSGIDYGNKPEVVKFVCKHYFEWIKRLYDELDSEVARGSYLQSYLVDDLFSAMQLMDADHITRISFWMGEHVTSIVLNRTWQIWGMTNMFVDGQSIHDACFQSLLKDGFTTQYLLNWKESDQPSNGDK